MRPPERRQADQVIQEREVANPEAEEEPIDAAPWRVTVDMLFHFILVIVNASNL